MKKASAKKHNNDLRREYDLSRLKGGVRGKYYQKATAGHKVLLIEPKLSEVFPDTESVNRALRLLADTVASATGRKPETSNNSEQAVEAKSVTEAR